MMEPAGAGVPTPRAFLRVGGATLARHQLGLALAMECQRVICIAREVTPELIALQHDTEQAGSRFHIVAGPRALVGLITANDDLLALGDGLLADPQEARALMEPGHVVLVQPVETGVAAGFERIDLNHAVAGAMRIPGRLVEHLQELPSDCDVFSALTRVALQAGVPMHEVPVAAREGARWGLIRDETEAHAIEKGWVRMHIGERQAPTPMVLISRLGLLTLGPSLLHAGNGSKVALVAAFAALLLGLGSGFFGLVVGGFLLCACAAVLCEGGAAMRRIERASLSLPPAPLSVESVLGWLIDLVLIILVVWSAPPLPWDSLVQRVFAPLMLILLARLVPTLFDRGWAAWIQDRLVLSLLLALAAAVDVLIGTVQTLTVALAIAGLAFRARRSS